MWTFDEVGNLEDQVFTVLRRTTLGFSSLTIWSLFLSTNSIISRLVAPVQLDPSSRVRQLQLKRFPPFYAFPIDLEATHRLKGIGQLKKPLGEFSTVHHMSSFGRPLWTAYSTEDPETLQQFVQQNLLGGGLSLALNGSVKLWTQQVFALAAARICLDPAKNSTEAIALADNAVNMHLRAIVGWSEDPSIILTTTISEPLVSDAAAGLLMERWQGVYIWQKVLETLGGELLSRGLLMKGELLARLILVLAADFTRKTNYDQKLAGGNPEAFLFSQPMELRDFFRQLFGDELLHNAHHSLLRTPVAEHTSDAFRGALLNFNHFIYTLEPLPADPNRMQQLLRALLRKHEALQLSSNQEFWDLLIPIYLGSSTEEFDLRKTSAILVQVKNRLRKTTLIPSPRQFSCFFDIHKIPVVHILLDLGVEPEIKVHSYLKSQIFCITSKGRTAATFPFLGTSGLASACSFLAEMEFQEAPPIHQQIIKSLLGVKMPTGEDKHDMDCDDNDS